jgi:hypothetical protein
MNDPRVRLYGSILTDSIDTRCCRPWKVFSPKASWSGRFSSRRVKDISTETADPTEARAMEVARAVGNVERRGGPLS